MTIKRAIRTLLGGTVLTVVGSGITHAQETQPLEEILVTGTFIRGATAPTGTNLVSLSQQDVIATGATTANEVLATIPQVSSNFNRVRSLPSVGSGITNLSPTIRPIGAAGGTTTLVLMDGHRFVNAGVLSTSPDPDVIPPGVLERVEVVPDGGSSTYGSDAVGGVINFITRRRFDGLEFSGHYGVADNYDTTDLNLLAGTDWGSGSGYLAYSYADHDDIFGRDRKFVQQVSDNGGQCGAGTVFVGATSYALPGRTPGTITNCDITDDATFYPQETRNSVFAGLTQQLSDTITLDVRAFYTERKSVGQADPEANGSGGGGQTVVICSPAVGQATCSSLGGAVFSGYVPVAGDTGVQTVAFNYGGLVDTHQSNDLEEYQITPSVEFQLGGSWQLSVLGSYGRSKTDGFQQIVNAGAQPAAIAAGLLNPYDPRSSNQAALSGLYQNFIGKGTQELTDGRAIADGDLFDLPGGSVRVAVGAEYLRESLNDLVFAQFTPGTEQSAGPKNASRNITSAFAEVVVPIVSATNAFTGVQSLTLSASGRYDDYSDFGDTFNPKFGLTYKPAQWLTLRANKGESFNAPSLADTNAPDTRSFSLPAFVLTAPGVPVAALAQQLVVVVGGNPNLGPQEADTWSAGLDIEPDFAKGLRISATYYDIHLTNQIAIPPIGPPIYTPAYSQFATLNPSQAQVEAATAEASPYLGTPIPLLYTSTYGVYSLLDFRRHNLGEVKQDGVDFEVRYDTSTSFGAFNAGIAGTQTLHREVSPVAGGAFTDILDSPGGSDFAFVTSVGGQFGNLTASAAWNHTEGYDLNPPVTTAQFGSQTHVGSFDTVDLFFQYDLGKRGFLDGLSLTLNVENVLDEEPPFYNGSDFASLSGYANGSTLGRLALLGVRMNL